MSAIKTNYIFVDYENVKQVDLTLIEGKPVKVILVMGPRDTKLPKSLSLDALDLKEQVEIVDVTSLMGQAVDMVLAWELGKRVAADPEGYFHIVALDKHYDALVTHLMDQKKPKLKASRVNTFEEIPVLVNWRAIPAAKRLEAVRSKLERMRSAGTTGAEGRPRTELALRRTIESVCFKQLNETEVGALVNMLKKKGYLKIEGAGRVSYELQGKAD